MAKTEMKERDGMVCRSCGSTVDVAAQPWLPTLISP